MKKTHTFSYDLNFETKLLHIIKHQTREDLFELFNTDTTWPLLNVHLLIYSIGHFFTEEKLPVYLVRSFVENEINLLLPNTSHCIGTSLLHEMSLRAYELYHTTKAITHPKLLEVINLVHYHLYAPLSVNDLALQLQLSPTHLSTLFNTHYHMSLKTYILTQKLERAKHILRYTKNSTQDISIGLGFSSQSYFCQSFKRYTGMSPTTFRNSYNI